MTNLTRRYFTKYSSRGGGNHFCTKGDRLNAVPYMMICYQKEMKSHWDGREENVRMYTILEGIRRVPIYA